MRSKAVVFPTKNQVEFLEVESSDPGEGDIVVEVTHSWISNGTEGSYLRGERSDGDRPYMDGDPLPFPVVAGYQKIGKVISLGDQVEGYEIGQTVFATIGRVEGMHHWYAGHVSPSVCPQDHVWPIPDGKDPLAYTGLVLMQVGFNAGMRAPVQSGDSAVVIGDGLVGHWTAQTLSMRGAQVALVGRHDQRLAHFQKWPNAHLVNSSKSGWLEEVSSLFPDGVHVAVDTVGDISLFESITPLMRRFGHLVSAGFYGVQDCFSLQPPRYSELSIHLVSGWTRERMNQTHRELTEGKLESLSLITHHFDVQEAARAWKLIESRKEHVLGVILDW